MGQHINSLDNDSDGGKRTEALTARQPIEEQTRGTDDTRNKRRRRNTRRRNRRRNRKGGAVGGGGGGGGVVCRLITEKPIA